VKSNAKRGLSAGGSELKEGHGSNTVALQLAPRPLNLSSFLSVDLTRPGARFLEVCVCLPDFHLEGATIPPNAPDTDSAMIAAPYGVTVRRV
jgi:hypothetical protein